MPALDELRQLIAHHAGGRGLRKVRVLDGVFLTWSDHPSEVVPAMSEPSVAIVAQGVKRTVLNGVRHDHAAGQYLVVSVDLPVSGQALAASGDEPFAVFSMTLTPQAVAPLLLDSGDSSAPQPFPALAVSTAGPQLLDPVVRLLRLVDCPRDRRVLEAGYRREILWRLLTGEHGALVRQIGRSAGTAGHIARAIRRIRQDYHAPLRVADLAALAGMSPSMFHRHFRAVTSMTPIQFQKRIRLREARVLLATEAANVTEAGYRVGYESPSQFSREYRREFGVSPSQDTGGRVPLG
ncbi:AraC family transcriptional regulator [Amycolatopsis jiangsuensis]|uniref:AraC-like DNA-binding protein n=1 Tax=Amycolatopsis jiangsuensis TaxID=1181879 RepID=A0A840IRN9_9PSEU|nr:AraC family transcriptional regulator [Amycolatopsis jiangsuensis]MBB4683694.1 AraC-like DNA-binding protein [Amycolatopsis jiangsuensis]